MFSSLLNGVKVAAFAWYSVKIRVIFGVRFERRYEQLIKKQTYTKKINVQTLVYRLLNIFAIFHQNWSLQILSYTVSNLVQFLRDIFTKLPVTSAWLLFYCADIGYFIFKIACNN